jgi:multiple antibiotic resistance protein
MDWAKIIRSATLLVVLLNPFLLSVYLLDLVQRLSLRELGGVLVRAAVVSGIVFGIFAWLGDMIFRDVFQVRFAAFLVFGGLTFVLVAVRFMFNGPAALEGMRGRIEPSPGSVAMPFMIGAGTINASVLAGSRQPLVGALIAIALALVVTVGVVLVLKTLHDFVSTRSEKLVDRYVDLCGRASALVIGAMAVEMIFQGIEQWLRISGVAATGQ